ncbi:MAG: acetate/propionate family kinase, partial [Patescibacteria group bacterium]|nr:acetate/propionate family kinase [Patescibacteria group bacterium]
IYNKIFFHSDLVKELEKIKSFFKDIQIIGHRVVHGGEEFRKSLKIDKNNLKELEKNNKLAPLHNPFNLLGIKSAQKIFSSVPQIAVFDTEFYVNLPEKAYIYPLPEKLIKKYQFRRFGFHGISHEYVAQTGAEKINKQFNKLKIITCHLGGGSSITAIKNGKAIDTSMGFTPMEGLIMMTRSGDIDPGIVLELSKIFSPKRAEEILNSESGLKAISGTGDMLKILKKAEMGNKKAKLALGMFAYRIQKYIGAYVAVLGGCDLLIFTGTIGFGSSKIRNIIIKNLSILKKERTKILAIKPNEELAIAKKIINKK